MNGHLLGVGFDGVCTGFQVDYLQEQGILVTNGEFVAHREPSFPIISPKTAIVVSETCTGNIRFTNCNFWGWQTQNVVCNGESFLSFSNCYFWNDKEQPQPQPMITNNAGRIQVCGCSFKACENRVHVQLNAGTAKAIITSNNAINITNPSSSHVIIENNTMLQQIIANNE